MAHEQSVSFKACLSQGGQDEVRRFAIDKNAVASFNYLEEKLKVVFPALAGKSFKVAWKDGDGDYVVISSDEELIIALTEMSTEPRRLFLSVNDAASHAPSASVPPTFHAQVGPVHEGVICDSCDGVVQGVRYKCTQCFDYDLCATCESKGIHVEHCMLKMPTPMPQNPRLNRRFAHHLEKMSRASAKKQSQSEEKGEGGCPFSKKQHMRHGHRHGSWLDAVTKYMNEWANLAENDPSCAAPSNQQPSASGCQDAGNNTQKNTAPGPEAPGSKRCMFAEFGAPPTGEATKMNDAQHSGPTDEIFPPISINLLHDIGQTIAGILQPLGIDVDIAVHPKKQNVPPTATNENSAQTSQPESEHQPMQTETSEPVPTNNGAQTTWTAVPIFKTQAVPAPVTTTNTTEAENIQHAERLDRTSPEHGWTIVDDDSMQDASVTSASNASASQPQQSPTKEAKEDTPSASTTPPSGNATNGGNTTNNAIPNPMTFAHIFASAHPQAFSSSGFSQSRSFSSGDAAAAPEPPMPGFHHIPNFPPNFPMPPPPSTQAGPGVPLYPNLDPRTASSFTTTTTSADNASFAAAAARIAAQTAQAAMSHINPFFTVAPTNVAASGATTATPAASTTRVRFAPTFTQASTPIPTPQASAPAQPAHPDPRIAKSLAAMQAMGFNNEGGWLATVLERVDGDVGRAVDLLQPIKKN